MIMTNFPILSLGFWCCFFGLAIVYVNAAEYCLSESFNASCGSNEVILMTHAMHGRMSVGKCIKMEYEKVSCQKDVLPQLDGACSGRQACLFSVARLRDVAMTCNPDLSTYLEATYKCIHVQSPGFCPPEGRVSMATPPQSGHLLLRAPDQNLRLTGTSGCPWIISVDPYQKLRFYLLTFGPSSSSASAADQQATVGGTCTRFLVFEETRRVQERLCRAPVRQVLLYTSTTNRVSVSQVSSVPEKTIGQTVYILQYEAIGCPSLLVAGDSWVTQDGQTATVRCNRTDETWFLSCDGRQWKGEMGNCTSQQEMLSKEEGRSQPASLTSFSYGLVTAVVIGVLLGVVIGAVPLGLAYVCLRRRWKQPSAGFVRDNVYDPDFYKTVDEEGRPIYPALMGQTPTGRRLLQPVDYCYGARYPSVVGQCQSGGHPLVSSDRHHWELQQQQGEGAAVRGRSTDCLDRVEITQIPTTCTPVAINATGSIARCATKAEHVYESAGFTRAQLMSSATDQQQPQQTIGLLPVYYDVEGKLIQCSGNPVSVSS